MDFERKLYIIRKVAERQIIPPSVAMGTDFYIASLSSRTVVYKGMLTSVQLRHFYLDLSDLDFTTAIALVHSRFSTNTFPSWARVHPNRYIVHNGEINTIQGNIHWLNARESKSRSPYFPDTDTKVPYDIKEQEKVFGYTQEDLNKIVLPMARDGKHALDSMGVDVPLAILSEEPQLLYDYFQENFAQVTNSPVDGIRESIVTSAIVMCGNVANIMDPDEKGTAALFMKQPILTTEEMSVIKSLNTSKLRSAILSMLYPVHSGPEAMETAIESICIDALKAIKKGANILILSDRGVNYRMAAIPALLATAALHNYLIRQKVRSNVGLILESGEPREVHHFCALIGYGLTAVNPYLALETVKELMEQKKLGVLTYAQARDNYIKAAAGGVLNVMTKMGISTVHSYHGAQIFEAVGIKRYLINKYFVNTPSRIEGIGLAEIAKETALRHQRAYKEEGPLPVGGFYLSQKGGLPHILNQGTVTLLRGACQSGDYAKYKEYTQRANQANIFRLRDLLEFAYSIGCSIPIEEVEPVENIVRRFRTGTMSYGALSKEAHECIAVAMNRLGAMSNTGEGGEDPARFML